MRKYIFLISILMLYASMAFGQGISVTIPSINAPSVGSTVTVPLNVSNFNNIGAVTFNIQYDRSVLTYTGMANTPTSGTFTADTSNGNLGIAWYNISGANFATKFADIKFTYNGGSSDLKFVPIFEVTDLNGVVLNVTRTDGGVFAQLPEIKIATVSGSAGTAVTVPVTATNLSNVAAISLKILYDQNVLTYTGNANILANSGITIDNAVPGVITISKYSGSVITNASAKLCDLKFDYKGGTSNLTFSTTAGDCELTDPGANVIETTLTNGKVSGSQATITIGTINNATAGAAVTVPVNAANLSNVAAISLKILYDKNVLTYTGNANILANSGITIDNAVAGVITISKYSGSVITNTGAKLCDLKFDYQGGSSNLTFSTTAGDCELTDPDAKVISTTLNNGKVSGSQATLTIGTINNATTGTSVTIPVNATNLSDVAAISLKILYNQNVLTYTGNANILANSGITIDNAVAGVITISKYSGDPITNASAKLCDLKFDFKGGSSNLTFSTTAGDCELTDPDANVIATTLNNGKVSAGNLPEVKITSKQASPNTAVVIPVTATNLSNVAAISLKILYDQSVLTYTGNANILANSGITIDNAVAGVITISKYSGDPITNASAKLCDLKFDYKGGSSNLTFSPTAGDCELTDPDANVIATTFTSGKVTPVQNSAVKVSVPNYVVKSTGVGSDITIPLSVANFLKIGSISLKLEYDPSVLTYKSASNKANPSLSVDNASGILTIGWYGSTPMNIASGKLVDLKFNYKGQTSQLNFDLAQSEITDSAGVVLYVEYTNGKVVLNRVPAFTNAFNDTTVHSYLTTINYGFKAVDPDGSALTYSLENAPTGAAIVAARGSFSWTPTEAQASKQYNFKVVVTDGVDTVKHNSSITFPPLGVDAGHHGTPTEFALYQNNPNPFNPTTRIEYALPKESQVTLKVYNLLGQEVATVVNEFQKAGYHYVNFNASNLTTGLYLYRLEASQFTSIKKMMLVK